MAASELISISLFFDNEVSNLTNNRKLCPNVIPIIVPDSGHYSQIDIITNFKLYYNSHDIGTRNYIRSLLKLLRILYPNDQLINILDIIDPESGININIITSIMSLIQMPEFKSKYYLTSCIFDIDRTILKTEGIYGIPTFTDIASMRDLITRNIQNQIIKPILGLNINKDIDGMSHDEIIADVIILTDATNIETTIFTNMDIAKYYLGGEVRITYLKEFFKYMFDNNINPIFLTNNKGYCLSLDLRNNICIANADLIELQDPDNNPVLNPTYNWMFYDVLVASEIIE